MDDLDYKLYVIAELSYKKLHPGMKEKDLYPFDWYNINDYKLKNKIIAQAIKENKLIKDTSSYQQRIEGIRK